ncbi:MAG: WD40 repeat domain-containing protein [Spirochaetaceae bacterium]|jgi:outer membrane protein assembly factor BamB|nr:WD40 repeat domain-containing protein [Spirochaetaceae bacterium]
MTPRKLHLQIVLGTLVFLGYAFLAVSPIPEEDVLLKDWIRSFESTYADTSGTDKRYPFEIGSSDAAHFGYFDKNGVFSINRITQKNLSLSDDLFAEYEAVPREFEIKNSANETVLHIENTNGYPLFLNDRIYLVSLEQNAITEIAEDGSEIWSYAFASPLTCIAGAQGHLLLGTLDGTVELLDENGRRVFFFETGGSRITCIYGVSISRDLSHIGVISGIDDQRFLLFEQYAGSYQVAHHEFIGDGKRRPVYIRFLDGDSRLAFEYEDGLGLYDIKSRTSYRIPLDGEIAAMDNEGGDGLFFLVTKEEQNQKHLIGIKYPASVIVKTPFKSAGTFLHRADGALFVGSDRGLASFALDKR